MNTYGIRFRTKDHADCTCYIPNQPTPQAAIDYVRAFYGSKIGPNSAPRVFLVIDENHGN